MKFPKQIHLEQDATHRLIPYRYSDRAKPVLNRLSEGDDDLLRDLTELEGATNDRLLGESGRLPGVSTLELVSGFRLAHIVNATFTHASPLGGRFNRAGRGAWYAAFELETSQKEKAHHRSTELKEIRWRAQEVSDFVDYLADFRHEFHDIRNDRNFADCLDPGSYETSQALGAKLLAAGSAGIIYPSVRRNGGVCIGCFRPPLVLNVREGPLVTFTFENEELRAVKIEG
jgi:RES domain-containing protein